MRVFGRTIMRCVSCNRYKFINPSPWPRKTCDRCRRRWYKLAKKEKEERRARRIASTQ